MKTKLKHLLSGTTIAAFLFLAIASTDNQETEQDISSVPASQAIQIGAHQLYKDYEDNEVSADQKYKNKILFVAGRVSGIGKDITDEIYITLAADEFDIGQVQCFMSKNHTDQVAQLKKGMRIIVKGKCDGKMMNILLNGCSIQ